MTRWITIDESGDLDPYKSLLEEIVRQTTPTARSGNITIEIRYGTRTKTDEEYEGWRTSFAYTEVDDEAGRGTITLYEEGKNLTHLAFQGLVYSMMGAIFGVCLYDFTPENKGEDLFSEQNTPKREAIFDFLMLRCGGTVEALVAYRVETEKKPRQKERKEEGEIKDGGFAVYCATLDKLQIGLGTQIYKAATITKQELTIPPSQIIYDN